MRTKPFILLVLFVGLMSGLSAQRVAVQQVKPTLQTRYAAEQLTKALIARHYTIVTQAGVTDITIRLTPDNQQLGSEAYSIAKEGNQLTITGGDARGLIYGSLSVVEALQNGTSLQAIKSQNEKPHLPLRAIKFDLPWDTYRHSDALDLHYETCRDTLYWKAFLDMMVANRFNALSLWNLHPYTYMIRPTNFPAATPFNDQQLAEWQSLFHAIFRMASERAIDTYLVPFNIFTSPEFSKAYNVNPKLNNLEHFHFIDGDTSAIVKRYTRECVTQVLQEYPELTGFGLTLGEAMGGMSPQQREDWMKATIIDGMRQAGRKTKLIHRIPFSSTTGSLGVTSIETEKLTRKSIESEGALDFIEGPIWADLKYNWSHAHSTPTLVKVHGGKLYDTYFKPDPTAYKITWTVRNEDFFCLRWGVPDFVRAHIAANNQSYVGGYFLGSETYIPAKDYFTKPGGPVDWKYAFERQWLFYKLWGRLLYNPTTPDAIFKAEFVRRYGAPAAPLLEAYALASATPLRLASAFDFTWDFSLYSEGMMAFDSQKNVSYISVNQQITQPTLDPNYVSVTDYVKTMAAGGSFGSGKITPPILASMLETDCRKSLQLVRSINVKASRSLQYEVSDVQVWANLGLHLAEKLKAAVALQTYRTTGQEAQKQAAIQHLKAALRYWDTVIAITRPLYNDMPLVHLTEQKGHTWEENNKLRFHWEKLRPDVMKDIELAEKAKPDTGK
ncbi:glycoside hydrolase family 20 zincin-like fold domain-containing protein [Spirosoma fluviale]|uniref:Glycosyl hydrolase family 20, domain 2 n=1 Tax=Spirosoma fluviale TaxID=1597977 RepID=A0A286F5K4_9BACT|nr:glycoside hydrolase family 20 zincin-like fold domain-containing protein [Spirosoma fluviale]SOD78174.1 Glycosyl hydrolase family 20, domain 2 [Spirosoma fluviale]